MSLSDLKTLIDASAQNKSQFKGLSAAYEALMGGTPSIDGYTFLINANNASNFGANPSVVFNDENIYINTINALYQGNATAKANFDAILSGAASIQDKLNAVYDYLIPVPARTDEGRAYFLSQASFYTARAAELGITGDNGPAVVAFAALTKIAVDNDIPGLGDGINDLLAAVGDGTAQIPQGGSVFTPMELADGTAFDGDDPNFSAGQTFTLTEQADHLTGLDGGLKGSKGTVSNAGDDLILAGPVNIGPVGHTLGAGDVIDGGTGEDLLRIIDINDQSFTPNLKNVESVEIQVLKATTTVDLINASDIKDVGVVKSVAGAALTLNNINDDAVLSIESTTGADVMATFADGAIKDNTLDFRIEDAQGAATKFTVDGVTNTAPTKISLLVGGAKDNFFDLNAGANLDTSGLATLTVGNVAGDAGTGGLTVNDNDAGSEFDALTQVDVTFSDKATFKFGSNNQDVTFNGGAGATTLTLGNGNSTITTQGGADSIKVGNGDNTIVTGAGADKVDATAGGDQTIDLGAGDDRVDFAGSLGPNDTVNGGADKDTVGVDTIGTVDGADDLSKITNVEHLAFTSATSGILDVSKTGANAALVPTSINEFSTEAGLTGDLTLAGLQNNVTVNLHVNLGGGSDTVTLDHASDTGADVLNLNIVGQAAAGGFSLAAPDAETVNLGLNGGKAVTVNQLTAGDLATLNIAGGDDLTVTSAAANLTTVAAGSATGDLHIKALQDGGYQGGASVSVTTGSGNDTVGGGVADDTLNTGDGDDHIWDNVSGTVDGADTITTGAGADTLYFRHLGNSSAAKVDTVTDFDVALDTLVIDSTLFSTNGGATKIPNAAFNNVGTFASFGQAQGATIQNDGQIDVVFQSDTKTLWIDLNDDGTLNANDLQIKLDNVSSISGLLIQSKDMTPPNAVALDLDALSDTLGAGTSGSDVDDLTNDTTPDFVITLDATHAEFDLVEIFENGVSVATYALTAADILAGTVTINVTATTTDGAANFTAQVTDLAGNKSAIGPTLVVTFDSTLPVAPLNLDLLTAQDTGASNSDNITATAAPTISVDLDTLGDPNLAAGHAITLTGGTGSVTVTLTAADIALGQVFFGGYGLNEGANALVATITDPAGNVSLNSTALNVTLDTTAPVAATFTSIQTDTFGAGTDGTNADLRTKDNTSITFNSAEAGLKLELMVGATVVDTINSSAAGANVFATGYAALAEGAYTFSVRSTDLAGNVTNSAPTAVIIDKTAAFAVTTTGDDVATAVIDLDAASDTGGAAFNADNLTSDQTADIKVHFSGLEVGSLVTLSGGAAAVGLKVTATDVANGYILFDEYGLTANSANNLTATLVDLAGNTDATVAGEGITVTHDNTGPAAAFSGNTGTVSLANTSKTITINFGEAIQTSSFTLADITAGGSASGGELGTLVFTGLAGSGASETATGATFVYTESGNTQTAATFAIAAGTYVDAAGNNNLATAAVNQTVDTLRPTINAITAAHSTTDLITVQFSENVNITAATGFQFTVNGAAVVATVSSGNGSNTVIFQSAFNFAMNDDIDVAVLANSFEDAVQNANVQVLVTDAPAFFNAT